MSALKKTEFYLRAGLLLPFVAWSLRFRGLKRTCERLGVEFGTITSEHSARSTDPRRAEELHLMVHRVARYLPLRLECLPRSIVTCHLLRSTGESPLLQISVSKTDCDLHAHAWVQLAGNALGEVAPETKGLHPLA